MPPQKHRNALAGDAVCRRKTSESPRKTGQPGGVWGRRARLVDSAQQSRRATCGAKSSERRPPRRPSHKTGESTVRTRSSRSTQRRTRSCVVNCPGPARRATAASCSTQGRGQSGSNASSKISSDSWRGCTAAKGRNTKRAGSAVLSRRLPGAPRDLHAERWQTTPIGARPEHERKR